MAISIEPNFITRVRFTPLLELLRGDANGRLHWRYAIDQAVDLPLPVRELITRVVSRTRLSRTESRGVADELIAHFRDGIAAGESESKLIERFGEERAAAKLIRRAKMRNRSLLSHAARYALRTLLVILAIYALVLIRFFASHPTVRVDYLAQLNAGVSHLSDADRAWPLYRRAILAMGITRVHRDSRLDQTFQDPETGDKTYFSDLTPADPHWPQMKAWLDEKAATFALIREAASKPELGFVLGSAGSMNDAELGWTQPVPKAFGPNDLNQTMIGQVMVPHLTPLREFAWMLVEDIRDARASGDSPRVVADIGAMTGIARQLNDPLLIVRLQKIGIDHLAIEEVEQSLQERPELFTDAQLVGLAHLLSTIGGDAPSSLIDMTGERMFFLDVMQHAYTDDGRGGGRLTADGAKLLQALVVPPRDLSRPLSTAVFATGGISSAVKTRRDVTDEYDRLMRLIQSDLARPLRFSMNKHNGTAETQTRLNEINESPLQYTKYAALARMISNTRYVGFSAERVLGMREATEVGLALELYRRRHGEYPATLDAVVPQLLPSIPADRFDGKPVRYRLDHDRPVVYSVGSDLDDDGGAMYLHHGIPERNWGVDWASSDDRTLPKDGDWILFDGRRPADTPEGIARAKQRAAATQP